MRTGYTIIDAPRLAPRTTMGLGGEAAVEVRVSDAAGTEAAFTELERLAGKGERIAVLGGGSNVIIEEGRLPLALLTFACGEKPHVIAEDGDEVLVRMSADTRLPGLLGKAASWGLSGLEPLCGIPGSVGGSVVMNAGSYGANMGDVLKSVQAFTPEAGLMEYAPEEFGFGYRTAELRDGSEWFAVTAVTVKLRKDAPEAVRARMVNIFAQKRATQPVTAKSAGCVFKNPAGMSAGKLLDEAGFRGRSLRKDAPGGMRFSSLHANFLVNEGDGSFAEARELIARAREAVAGRFGITLDLEVRIWP